jgi:hypothetical protein
MRSIIGHEVTHVDVYRYRQVASGDIATSVTAHNCAPIAAVETTLQIYWRPRRNRHDDRVCNRRPCSKLSRFNCVDILSRGVICAEANSGNCQKDGGCQVGNCLFDAHHRFIPTNDVLPHLKLQNYMKVLIFLAESVPSRSKHQFIYSNGEISRFI